jgi:hypothetical protein
LQIVNASPDVKYYTLNIPTLDVALGETNEKQHAVCRSNDLARAKQPK